MPDMGPVAAAGGCGCVVTTVIVVITMLANISTLARDEQMVVSYLDGKSVVNGPGTKLYNPFRERVKRKASKLGHLNYILIKDTLNGQRRVEVGPKTVFLKAYEEVSSGIKTKYVLKKDQYIRFIDRLSGEERLVRGAASLPPGPWEETAMGVQQASFVNSNTAIIILNKKTGQKRLYTEPGLFFPDAYEVVVDTVPLTRILPHESMVVRTAHGRYEVYLGSGQSGTQQGASFFLKPFEEIVTLEWSTFSEPPDGQEQSVGKESFDRIDMRTRKVFFQYDVRTNDNVALRMQGTIFWKVSDVAALIAKTADPAGDVWYKARNALISTVSQVDLETFRMSFNTLIKNSFRQYNSSDFYMERGVQVERMEITGYDPIDPETAATLQEIIEETTERINRLQEQRSDNEVKAAKLVADILLETERTKLIETQSKNLQLLAAREGEAEGVLLARAASGFLDGLNASVPDMDKRLSLYKLQMQLETHNKRTKHIASGKATTLFLTPEDLNLQLGKQDFQEL